MGSVRDRAQELVETGIISNSTSKGSGPDLQGWILWVQDREKDRPDRDAVSGGDECEIKQNPVGYFEVGEQVS